MKAQPKLKKALTEFVKVEGKRQSLLAQLSKLDTSKIIANIENMAEALVAKAPTDAERDHWGALVSAIATDFKSKEGAVVAKSYVVAFDKAFKKAAKAADAEVKAKKDAEAKAKKEAEEAKRIAKENAKLQARLEKEKLKSAVKGEESSETTATSDVSTIEAPAASDSATPTTQPALFS